MTSSTPRRPRRRCYPLLDRNPLGDPCRGRRRWSSRAATTTLRRGSASRRRSCGRGIHILTDPASVARPVTVHDEHGPVHVYGIPFLEPSLVRHVWPDVTLRTQEQTMAHAMRLVRRRSGRARRALGRDRALLRRRRRARRRESSARSSRAGSMSCRCRLRRSRLRRARPHPRPATNFAAGALRGCAAALQLRRAGQTSRFVAGRSGCRGSGGGEWMPLAGARRLVTITGHARRAAHRCPVYVETPTPGCARSTPTRRRSASRCAGCSRDSRTARPCSTSPRRPQPSETLRYAQRVRRGARPTAS